MRTVVFLNPVEYAIDGDMRIYATAGSDLDGISRRISKTKLLDGSVHVSDFGSAEGDSDRTITSNMVGPEQLATLRLWFTTYSELVMSIPSGVFLVAPVSLAYSQGTMVANFSVKRRLDL